MAALLKEHRAEVKVLFYKLAGVDGRVSFQELSTGLAACGAEWGLLSEHLAGFISPEHIFGTAGGAGSETYGDGTLSYAEFVGALKSESTRAKVLAASKGEMRVQLKVLYYTLAGGDGVLTIEEFAAGLAAALADQAEGWGFTAAEMQTVFSLESFGGDGGDVDGSGAAIRQYTVFATSSTVT